MLESALRYRKVEAMDDIRRQDLNLFLKELISPGRLIAVGFLGLFTYMFWRTTAMFQPGIPAKAWLTWFALIVAHAAAAYSASVKKRFLSRRFEALWSGCQDRLT